MKKQLTILCILLLSCISIINGQTVITIAAARAIADTTTVTIAGIVISPNYQTSNRSYYIQDATGGIDMFRSGLTSTALNLGDSVVVSGRISTFNGLIEITPAADAAIVVKKSNATLPNPQVLTVNQFNTGGETYESHLTEVANLHKISGTWPTTKANATILLSDDNNKDTLTLFLDSDVGLYNVPEPSWPINIIGVVSQFAASGVGGYELLPRYATDLQGAISVDSARKLLGSVVTVNGVVTSPNFQTSNRSNYIWDGTGGVVTFKTGLLSPALNLADSVTITGLLATFNGLLEIQPLTDTSIVVIKPNAQLPTPQIITIKQFNTSGESFESHLVKFLGLTKLSGTWPTTKANATLLFTDSGAKDTLTVFLDSDMNLNSGTEPKYPCDIIGEASQFASTGIGGYQLLPRYSTDFVPQATTPVELTTFTANITKSSVVLKWETATELNNSGFDIERSADSKSFQKIAFVKGKGTTTQLSKYSYTDNSTTAGTYYYRLKQIDNNGTSKYSNVIESQVLAVPTVFKLSQNYPNPFNPSTLINFTVSKQGTATLKVFNTLGQEVTTLFNGQANPGQNYSINFNASGLSSGIYFYQLKQGSSIDTQKLMLLK